MKRIVVASMEKGAGKTSMIVGLSRAYDLKIGYMKPFGERIVYKKKRLLDYDSVLIRNLFELDESPEELSLGFDHSKLRFMYDTETLKQRVKDVMDRIGKDRDILFIEGGRDVSYGASLGLDPLSLADLLDAELVFVLSGGNDKVMDQIAFILDKVRHKGERNPGFIINKVDDPEDFMEIFGDSLSDMGASILGIIPYLKELSYYPVSHYSNVLFAKIIAGQRGLSKIVRNVFVGAMSGSRAIENPLFRKEDKLLITSGDRSDMVLAAIETDSAGIILTNNIVPPANLISKADERDIPLLLVQGDTFKTAKMVDDMEKLLMVDDMPKIELLSGVVKDRIDLNRIVE